MINKMKELRVIFSIVACLLLCLSLASCRTPASTTSYCQGLVNRVIESQESSLFGEPTEDGVAAEKELVKAYRKCSPLLKDLTITGTVYERIFAIDFVVYSWDPESFLVLEKVLNSLSGTEEESPVLFAAIVALKNSQNPPKVEAAKLAVKHLKGGKRSRNTNVSIFHLLTEFSPDEALKFLRSITDQIDLDSARNEWPLPAFISLMKRSKHAAGIAYAKDLEKRLSALPKNPN